MGTVLHLESRVQAWGPPSLFQSPSRWGRCCIESGGVQHRNDFMFQSPSRWGRCCISLPLVAGYRVAQVSVPFSMGTVLHRYDRAASIQIRRFQSPSRWGRCCILRACMGRDCRRISFSPLLDGDGVASSPRHLRTRSGTCGFSPLLDGDGVASARRSRRPFDCSPFQSPSRWGRCCIIAANRLRQGVLFVSVPFSMGTVLHRGEVDIEGCSSSVSVPFSMGTVLHRPRSTGVSGRSHVSVPFSMGTVLHLRRLASRSFPTSSFSPLLDGDGVASLPASPGN